MNDDIHYTFTSVKIERTQDQRTLCGLKMHSRPPEVDIYRVLYHDESEEHFLAVTGLGQAKITCTACVLLKFVHASQDA